MVNFPGRGKVAIVRTTPDTVVDDVREVMRLAGYQDALPKDKDTLLKINISWDTWYPACSSTPWQIEGVIQELQGAGYPKVIAAHNDTVVVDARAGEINNKHKYVTDKYKIDNWHLYEPQFEWVRYEPKEPFLVLDRVFPEGVFIPKDFYGRNIIHLPTVKTHVFTTITGAMKNAFGGLLSRNRHWTHSVIHETVVDLLQIQQDIHTGIFAVMDGTFAGDGPGPRAMRVHEKDLLLASADQVAIDAMSAYLQGFDPMELDFIRLGHERGLGVGNPTEIEVVGLELKDIERFRFVQEDTFASKGQKMIYHGWLKGFEKPLLRSPIVPWSYAASNVYHNYYWYPFVGRKRVEEALKMKWGQLFARYGDGEVVLPGLEPEKVQRMAMAGAAAVAGGALFIGSRLLGGDDK
ncbi:MAG TPA: DUF362 domain-containing protein [Aggregatilineaceae bacterium]|nr:DUF362 domain-containing protein [Aggregatilineaceae bacterium]